MKLIKIDCCGHCPLKCRSYINGEYECQHPTEEGMELTDLLIIHPDCPLEDEKEKNNV